MIYSPYSIDTCMDTCRNVDPDIVLLFINC